MTEEGSKSDEPKRKKQLSYCRVCHSPASYSYFGVISCAACKVFFRRNAHHEQVNFIFLQIIRRNSSFRIISNVHSTINVRLIQTIVKHVHHVDLPNVFNKEWDLRWYEDQQPIERALTPQRFSSNQINLPK